jgi:ribonuclease J
MSNLRFIPLGGVGEIGKNMYVYEVDDQLLVVDAGLMFPDEKQFGVDIIVPDIRYLVENRERIQGIVITHGHEDHIGALGYVIAILGNVPIFAPPLAAAMIKGRLQERRVLDSTTITAFGPNDVVKVGSFEIHPVRVAHSIPDSFALVIKTPAGTVVHTGDFKLDQTPVDGQTFDLPKLSSLCEDGVLAIVSDTTNVERPGFVPSERIVADSFQRIIAEAPGRVIIASFGSQIHRMQMAIDASRRYSRKVTAMGRSMVQNIDICVDLGYINLPDDIRVKAEDIDSITDKNLTILTTGSQGEPLAGLSKMANGDHRYVTVRKGDTIVLSATPIPGNETAVWTIVNKLVALGAKVIYEGMMPVHVSGHGYAEELRLVLNLVNPQYVIPVHGEKRMLALYGKNAVDMGWLKDDVFELSIGDVLELNEVRGQIVDRVACGAVMLGQRGMYPVHEVVVKDRQFLAEGGFVVLSMVVDRETAELIGGPEVVSRGVAFMEDETDLVLEIIDTVAGIFTESDPDDIRMAENGGDTGQSSLSGAIRYQIRKLIEKRTGVRTNVLSTIIYV